MKDAIATTPIVGEIGLDSSARTPIQAQLTALRGVLALTVDTPRVLSIHSYRATDLVLRELCEFRPLTAILHWWLGTPQQTETALEAGEQVHSSPRPGMAQTFGAAGSSDDLRRPCSPLTYTPRRSAAR
jgi:Tat protein secretion system quality control protein TatD with DNase activity